MSDTKRHEDRWEGEPTRQEALQPGDPVKGMPGFVYINPDWPAGSEPCVECAEDLCEACGGSGEINKPTPAHHRASDIDLVGPCPRCNGTGIKGG